MEIGGILVGLNLLVGAPKRLHNRLNLPTAFGLTMEGQYIIKNLTLIAAALVVGGTARLRSRHAGRLQ